jgi:glycosyltransferase involved in cell wall biosynthesis
VPKVLIVTDNEPNQINGVVTTFKNIENHARNDGYDFVYLDPREFSHIDAPGYPEVKLSWPSGIGAKIKKANADHIHIATEGTIGMAANIWCRLNKKSFTTSYHTKFPEFLKRYYHIPESLTWMYLRWFHNSSKTVLATTDTMVKDLKRKGFKGNILPWTRGVDRGIFNQSSRDRDDDAKVLVCVSRVSKEKNLDEFCKLEYPKSHKIMVGDGPYRKELEAKYPNVEFVGFKTGKDLASYYANADVFVFPSCWETFGIVMIESMACGTPVAAYPVDGPRDVVDEGKTGYMENNLASAVHRCLGLNRNTVEQYSQRWSWESAWEIFKNNIEISY